MSRTYRSHITDSNYREARRGADTQRAVDDATDFRWADTGLIVRGDYERANAIREAFMPPWSTRDTRGGMLASASNSGCWDDDYTPDSGVLRRREDRAWRRDYEAEQADADRELAELFVDELRDEYDAWLDLDVAGDYWAECEWMEDKDYVSDLTSHVDTDTYYL